MFFQCINSFQSPILHISTVAQETQNYTRFLPSGTKPVKMKTTLVATLLGFSAIFASAAPVDEAIKRQPIKRSVVPTGTAYYPSASGSSAPYATGALYATGTVPAYAASTGGVACPTDGAVVCNGPSQFGICNFGKVSVFQPVAAGTQCVDGKIVSSSGQR